jgi:site-specific DNA-adenine methylase
MISIFCRIGRKNNLKKLIISKIPDDYNVYVEPFVGSGVIYLNTDLKGRKAVINDLDKKLIEGWKAVKKGITLPDDFSIEEKRDYITR